MRFVLLLVLVICTVAPITSVGNEFLCVRTKITVIAQSRFDQDGACQAVRKAAAFLESISLRLKGNLTIKLISQFPGKVSNHAIGQYDSRKQQISLLNYEAALMAARDRPAFRVPMSRALWQSYISHELAHAAAFQHFESGVRTFTASEYIAAVVQLTLLPQKIREDILRNYREVEAFDDANGISQIYYLMAPCTFAIKAYLHYLKPENGPKFISGLIHRGLPN